MVLELEILKTRITIVGTRTEQEVCPAKVAQISVYNNNFLFRIQLEAN